MGKHYATCGHEIEFGISMQVDEGSYEGYTYGTYCADCVLEYWLQERIVNSEFNTLIGKVIDHYITNDMNKTLWRLFRNEVLDMRSQ